MISIPIPASRTSFASVRRLYVFKASLVILLVAICWFGTLDMRALFSPDEGRYAEIPREMLASGDWITPRLNDLKYFEKPPLQYWLTAIAFSLFGQEEWAARLAPAALGFVALLMVLYTGNKLLGARAGALAALVLASSWAFYLSSQFLTLDMTLSAFLTFALCAFMLAQRHGRTEKHRSRWMMFAWVALAMAFLSKGLIALVLPGLALVTYSLWTRDFAVWQRLRTATGGCIFIALVAPWLVAVQLENPEFFHFFFIHEHIDRFAQSGHSRPGAWWYYIPVILLGTLPWTPSLVQAVFEKNSPLRSWAAPAKTFSPAKFCLAWTLSTVVFFSLSQSKLPAYIIPVLPATALLLGSWLRDLLPGKIVVPAWTSLLAGSLLVVVFLNIGRWQKFASLGDEAILALPWLIAAAASLACAGAAALVLLSARRRRSALLAIAAGTFGFWQLAFVFFESVEDHFSAERIVESINESTPVGADAPIFSLQYLDNSVPYYFGRAVTLVDIRGELGPGIDAEPHKAIASMAVFKARWINSTTNAFAVMKHRTYASLQAEALPMHEFARDKRLIIVSRHRIATAGNRQ